MGGGRGECRHCQTSSTPDVKKNKKQILAVISETGELIWKPSPESWFGWVVVQMHALIGGGCGEGCHCPDRSTPMWTENKGQIVAVISEVEDLEAISQS